MATSGAGLSDACFTRAVSFQSSPWFKGKDTITYVEGYLIPVHQDRKDGYSAFSAKVATLYGDYGALRIVDRWLDEAPQEGGAIHAEGARAVLAETSEASRDARTIAGAGPDEVVMLS